MISFIHYTYKIYGLLKKYNKMAKYLHRTKQFFFKKKTHGL